MKRTISLLTLAVFTIAATAAFAAEGSRVRALQLVSAGDSVTGSIGVRRADGTYDKVVDENGTYHVIVASGDKLELLLPSGLNLGVVVPPGSSMTPVVIDVPYRLAEPPVMFALGDSCGEAEPAVIGGSNLGSTLGRPTDPTVAGDTCGTFINDPSAGAWWSLGGTGTRLTATTCNPGTDYDTKLSVFCADCAAPTCIDGNDDGGSGVPAFCSEVEFCTESGSEYFVFVHGFGGATGNFEMTISDDLAPCVATVSCAPPVPTGGCCNDCLNPPFDCEIVTADRCAAAGGTYLGDDVACAAPAEAIAYVAGDTPIAIPDSDPAGIASTITVLDSYAVADVEVDVEITHTFIGDLELDLVHGNVENLYDNYCGAEADINTTFGQPGTSALCADISAGGTITDPTVSGLGNLDNFNGADSAGDWNLLVRDLFGGDTGNLESWTLRLRPPGTSSCGGPSSASSR